MDREITHVPKKKSKVKKRNNKFKKMDKRGRIVVKNLPFKMTEADVKKYFSKYGNVSEVKLPCHSDGTMMGCCFIQFSSRDKAAKAVADTNGKDLMGRVLNVSFALSKMSYIAARPSETPAPSIVQQQLLADGAASSSRSGVDANTEVFKEEHNGGNVKQDVAVQDTSRNVGKKTKKEKPLQKRGRLIVRNLPFKVTEAAFKEHFARFGDVHDVKLLRRPDGRLVGCGFVQYTWKQNAAKAILKTSGKPFMGRIIIVDWAVPKNVFEAKMQQEEAAEVKSEVEDEMTIVKDEDSPERSEQKSTVKERRHSMSDDSSQSDVGGDVLEEGTDGSVASGEESLKVQCQTRNRTVSSDVVEGCTVFVKNIPFSSTSEQLRTCMEQFGEVTYALVCLDPLTEHSKGTGFVKFKSKESVEQCLSAGEELLLSDQQLQVLLALPKQEIMDRAHNHKQAACGRDSRNLYLVKEGVVVAGTKAAVGVSATDMARRLQLEQWKSQMLRNLNMFVSRTRLVVHNIPPSWDDGTLRELFTQHVSPGTFIKEARVMRNMRDLNMQGVGRSKEYGFVTFGSHETALQALRSINNNPKIFTPAKRPIVAFSIENKTILNLKQRRLMKSLDKNPLARGKERKGRMYEERRGTQIRQDDERESEQFAGVAAKPGKVKLRSRFNLQTQAAVHSDTLRREKKKRKDERRASQLRQSGRTSAAEPRLSQVKSKKEKRKGEQRTEEVFSKLVDKYKRKLSNVSTVKKWYE